MTRIKKFVIDDQVVVIPMEEVNEDNNSNNNNQSSKQVSPLSGFPMAAFPPLSIKNQTETVTFNTCDQVKTGPTVVRPVPLFPTPIPSTRADDHSNLKLERDSLSLSLSLNPSLYSTFEAIPGLKNGDGIISVV